VKRRLDGGAKVFFVDGFEDQPEGFSELGQISSDLV